LAFVAQAQLPYHHAQKKLMKKQMLNETSLELTGLHWAKKATHGAQILLLQHAAHELCDQVTYNGLKVCLPARRDNENQG